MDDVALLPVLPWTAAACALVLVVALNVPVRDRPRSAVRAGGAWTTGRRAGPVVVTVVAALVVLSRTAGDTEVDNPVPALAVGLLWPLVLVLPGLLSPVLRRPAAVADDDAVADVRPAVVAAAALVGYLVLSPRATAPEPLGTALAVYAAAIVALGVALGRRAAARSEAVGLLSRWAALGPRLVDWVPPRGAAAVLAVVLGGAWAERLQRTTSWADTLPGRSEQVGLLVVAVVLAVGATAALAVWGGGHAAPVLLPLAAAAVLAGVLRRVLISAQLLWDIAGAGQPGIDPDPLGVAGGQAASLAVAAVGGVLAVAVLARRVGAGAARLPGTAVVVAATALTAAVTLTP